MACVSQDFRWSTLVYHKKVMILVVLTHLQVAELSAKAPPTTGPKIQPLP